VSALVELGYSASKANPALFLRRTHDGVVKLHTDVDDSCVSEPTTFLTGPYIRLCDLL
jgi:hypothetical protein